MTINENRSHWTWTPLLGWALLSCVPSAAWAQAPAPVTTATPGTATSASPSPTTGTQTLAPSDVSNIEVPNIDPTTGLPIDAGLNQVKPAVNPTTAANPVSTLPAVTPQTNTGSLTAGPTVLTTTPAPTLSEVQTLPSATTTILGAPFGSSSFVASPAAIGGGVPVAGVTSSIGAGGGGAGASGRELGISVGSFTLYPAIEINAGVDSNVFAQNPALGTMIGSFYTSATPSFELRSDWLNHAVNIVGRANFLNYTSAPTQNSQAYTLVADGRIDIQTDFYLKWTLGYVQSVEPLGTPNAVAATSPTIVNTIPLAVGLFQQIGRFYYDAKISATRITYIDNSQITSGGLPGSSRDIMNYGEVFRFGYDVSDDFRVFLQPELNQRRYFQPVDSVGQARNSDGQTMSIGFDWTPTATTSLEATIGYAGQNYYSGTGTTSALSYGLSGSWNGYAPLVVRPSIVRSIAETALSNFTSSINTTYGLDYNYLIHDAWTLSGGISLTTVDYNPAPGTGATARTDYFFRNQIGVLYSLRPQIQIGPFFEYDSATTTDPVNGAIFDREIFSVRLIARR